MRTVPAVLVPGQFACIAALLLGGSWALPWWAWTIFLSGLALFFLAAFGLGRSNFSVMPVPRANNVLSKRGIYRVVRHPMYLSVLLCGAALALGAPSAWRWGAWAACVAVLVVKVRFEERMLTRLHPEYPQVMQGVAHLFPGLW